MLPKTAYVRSKDWMAMCRTLPCGNCGREEYGQVVGAHANWSWADKGKSIKAHDITAALCYQCHMELDQGRDMTKAEREEMWLKALYRTVRNAVQAGKLTVHGG